MAYSPSDIQNAIKKAYQGYDDPYYKNLYNMYQQGDKFVTKAISPYLGGSVSGSTSGSTTSPYNAGGGGSSAGYSYSGNTAPAGQGVAGIQSYYDAIQKGIGPDYYNQAMQVAEGSRRTGGQQADTYYQGLQMALDRALSKIQQEAPLQRQAIEQASNRALTELRGTRDVEREQLRSAAARTGQLESSAAIQAQGRQGEAFGRAEEAIVGEASRNLAQLEINYQDQARSIADSSFMNQQEKVNALQALDQQLAEAKHGIVQNAQQQRFQVYGLAGQLYGQEEQLGLERGKFSFAQSEAERDAAYRQAQADEARRQFELQFGGSALDWARLGMLPGGAGFLPGMAPGGGGGSGGGGGGSGGGSGSGTGVPLDSTAPLTSQGYLGALGQRATSGLGSAFLGLGSQFGQRAQSGAGSAAFSGFANALGPQGLLYQQATAFRNQLFNQGMSKTKANQAAERRFGVGSLSKPKATKSSSSLDYNNL